MSDSHIQLTGRDAKVNAAMESLGRNLPAAYSRYQITTGEAAAWLNNNRDKLYMFHRYPIWRAFVIKVLNAEIEDFGNTGATSLVEMKEIIKILSEQAPVAAPASEQMQAAAPASEPEAIGKQKATIELTNLIDKLMVNDLALQSKAKHHLSFLSSEEQPPEKKQKEAKDLTEMMINHVHNTVDRLRAMEYITILKGNEGGYRQRTKHPKKHSKKSRKTKSRKSRKTKSRRH